jgi:hypothetical protein
VEIPAVPEEEARLRSLLPDLYAAGVKHLNLHQLRLTPHNARHLLEREYTHIHGPKVTVLESELCALTLVAHAAERKLPLAVNYCSFVYKHRFQAAAGRKRFGALMLESGESLTDSGHIRMPAARSVGQNHTVETPRLAADSSEHQTYAAAFLRPQASPVFPHREIPLSSEFSVFLERHPARPSTDAALQAPAPDSGGIYGPSLEESCEWITPGLGVYF